jgi:hypothetical protein
MLRFSKHVGKGLTLTLRAPQGDTPLSFARTQTMAIRANNILFRPAFFKKIKFSIDRIFFSRTFTA